MAAVDLSPFNSILTRLEAVADRIEGAAAAATAGGAAPAAGAAEDVTTVAVAFDALVREHVTLVEVAAKGTEETEVVEATEMFVKACAIIRDIFAATGRCRKPVAAEVGKFFGPAQELGGAAAKACDNRSPLFQHRKAVAESINIVAFFTVPSPAAHVQSVLETMDFHAMKVMQLKKEKDTAWIKALKAAVKAFQEFCTENCKLGPDWKLGGEDPVEYFAAAPLGSGAAAPSPAPGGNAKGKGKGPPPPKGGMPPAPAGATKPKPTAGVSMGEVFSGISNFEMGQLKKVTDDMKTKNQPKGEAIVPAPKPAQVAKAAAPARRGEARGPRGEPKFSLEKNTNWVIENYEGVQDLKVDEAVVGHLVVIINCRNATIQVTSAKVKCICIDGCERVNVICNDVLSTVELVNSDRIKVQILGTCNSVAIDKCNGVGIILSKASIGVEIVTSKSSEMNVVIPEEGGEEGDTIELPIPEQFVTRVTGPRKLTSEVSSIYAS